MKKENIYIDLSKCTDDEIKKIAFTIPRNINLHKKAFNYMSDGKTFKDFVCLASTDSGEWTLWNKNALFNKTELTYPDFIKLFEGREVTWNIFKPHTGSTETETMGRETIKSDNTQTLANALHQIEKLEAEKAELLEYLQDEINEFSVLGYDPSQYQLGYNSAINDIMEILKPTQKI